MAKEIIVLEVKSTTPDVLQIRYLLWLTTPKPIPTSAGSQWSGANASEISAIQAGTTIEEQFVQNFPQSFGTANIKAFLNAHWNDRQNYLNSIIQPGQYYGVFYDSSTLWSA